MYSQYSRYPIPSVTTSNKYPAAREADELVRARNYAHVSRSVSVRGSAEPPCWPALRRLAAMSRWSLLM